MFVKSLSLCCALLTAAPAAPAPDAEAPLPKATEQEAAANISEKSLLGIYLQVNTGTLLEFQPGGKLNGWPAGGSWKITGPHRVELTQMISGKEERLPIEVFSQKEGLIIIRDVNGEKETVPLHRLAATPLDAKAWQGECMIHVLVSGPKIATKRKAEFKDDGYVRTPEGGYWLRLLNDADGKKVLGFTSNLEDKTMPVSLYKTGAILVVFDQLEKPTLLSIIQLGKE